MTIVRVFDAPVALVFQAWTDPHHMKIWWGPHGFTNPVCELDPRPGGVIRICMDAPDFPDHRVAGVFKEVDPPHKLVFTTQAFIGENGVGGIENITTVLFEEFCGKTRLTLHVEVVKLAPEFEMAYKGMHEGWSQSLDRLIAMLAVYSAKAHPTPANGKICYLQIPANDIAVSSEFYRDVFGWQLRRRDDGSIAFDDGVNQVSGTWVTGRVPSPEPGILIFIMVDDCEATMTKVIAHGGKIVTPIGHDAPEITARFSDPAGNVMGIFQQR